MFFELNAVNTAFNKHDKLNKNYNLKQLLTCDFQDDPYFLEVNPKGSATVHNYGATMISIFLESNNTGDLQELCTNIRQNKRDVVEIIETAFSMSIEEIDCLCRRRIENTDFFSSKLNQKELSVMLAKVTRIQFNPNVKEVGKIKTTLLAKLDSPLRQEPFWNETWARFLVYELLFDLKNGNILEDNIAIAEGAVNSFIVSSGRNALTELLSNLISIPKLIFIKDQIKGAVILSNIAKIFDRLIENNPNFIEAKYHKVMFNLNIPEQFAFDRAPFKKSLLALCQDKDYGDVIAAGMSIKASSKDII